MNNWTIYQIVNYLINKEQSGNTFNAEEFQLILNEEYQLQTAYTQQGAFVTSRMIMDLAEFITVEQMSYTSGVSDYPTSMAYPVGMEYKRLDESCDGGYESVAVELVNAGELVMRKSSGLKPISYEYPLYEIASDIRIYPKTISTSEFTFLKKPNDAVFVTTTDANGEEVYDAAASTELNWNDMAKTDIISIILASVGLNLRSSDVLQTAEMYKTKGL